MRLPIYIFVKSRLKTPSESQAQARPTARRLVRIKPALRLFLCLRDVYICTKKSHFSGQGTQSESMAQDYHTLLLIDDNPADANLLRRQLQTISDYRFEFIHCRDAIAGQTILHNQYIDCLLLDYLLGAESGLTVMNNLRQAGHTVPIAQLEGNVWQCCVADNGIGIEPEYHEQIFAPFKRLHTQDEYEGSGIGLATCKKVIDQHKGHIWLESKPGAGTLFYFTLLKAEEAPVEESAAKRTVIHTVSPQQFLRILFADDDRVSSMSSVAHLEKAGHNVQATRNGEEALAALNTGSIVRKNGTDR